eukprot:gnl/TRDRNA2_/TRDRNA2_110127_c3_seq1.p1 gnl/TRDRNA2_/TRDRNA2_110127_c3~~gnl/TRDRNA2_/TRDRNA2_110127_c3_seq1.p1  ORF type:complete len:125 (+),score=25.89 gnl/TRDRNA2_/TRDRNA2_110127_c3_seq1:52-426(+)
MATQIFPFLGLIRPILRWPILFDEWSTAEALEAISAQHSDWCVCLLSGLRDEIVPPVQMKQLHNILLQNPPKVLEFNTFENGGHNDTPHRGGTAYWAALKKFMNLVSQRDARRQSDGQSIVLES